MLSIDTASSALNALRMYMGVHGCAWVGMGPCRCDQDVRWTVHNCVVACLLCPSVCRVDAKRAELQAELEREDAEERAASLRQWRSRREAAQAGAPAYVCAQKPVDSDSPACEVCVHGKQCVHGVW